MVIREKLFVYLFLLFMRQRYPPYINTYVFRCYIYAYQMNQWKKKSFSSIYKPFFKNSPLFSRKCLKLAYPKQFQLFSEKNISSTELVFVHIRQCSSYLSTLMLCLMDNHIQHQQRIQYKPRIWEFHSRYLFKWRNETVFIPKNYLKSTQKLFPKTRRFNKIYIPRRTVFILIYMYKYSSTDMYISS